MSERNREWEKANPEKVKETARKSREKHKEQRRLDHKAWVEKNYEKHLEYHRKYNKQNYLKNKERIDAKNKLYAQTHREEMVKNVQRYVAKNKEKIRTYNVGFNQTVEGKYRILLYRAKKWGAPYLSQEDFASLLPLPCIYCGESEKNRGIDRIDNSLGYSKENSAPACKLCNFMKKALSKEDFLAHIRKIAAHNI
mgnify:CR=1 FL=1